MKYIPIDPPCIELGFYFDEIPDWLSFQNMYDTVVKLGATPLDTCTVVVQGDNARELQFSRRSMISYRQIEYRIAKDFFGDKNTRVLMTEIANIIGTSPDSRERLELSPVSSRAMIQARHPVSILIDGSFLFPLDVMTSSMLAESKRLGKLVYSKFLNLVSITKPGYAAINVETSLQCPADLAANPGSDTFFDFYISNSIISSECREKIKLITKNAYVEELDTGLYVSVTPFFNPLFAKLDENSKITKWDMSIQVSKCIAAIK